MPGNGQVGSHRRGVAATAASDPDRVAIVDGPRAVTFGELDARANGLAVRLAELGVGPADIVGIGLRNRAEWFIVSHAIARLGAMFVPLSTRLTPGEAEYIVRDAGMKALVVEGPVGFARRGGRPARHQRPRLRPADRPPSPGGLPQYRPHPARLHLGHHRPAQGGGATGAGPRPGGHDLGHRRLLGLRPRHRPVGLRSALPHRPERLCRVLAVGGREGRGAGQVRRGRLPLAHRAAPGHPHPDGSRPLRPDPRGGLGRVRPLECPVAHPRRRPLSGAPQGTDHGRVPAGDGLGALRSHRGDGHGHLAR